VVLDERSFEPGKGREVAMAVAEVEGHPGLCVHSKPHASPVALGARAAQGRAVARQFRTMR
jgi:hypothetical protein